MSIFEKYDNDTLLLFMLQNKAT